MADKPTKSELAKLPGGEDFDVAGATTEDFDKHYEILERKAKLAALQPVQQVAIVAAPVPDATPSHDPSDIEAVHPTLGRRYFTEVTWNAMEEAGKHAGWEIAVPKPADIQ
jgi:hypothetical protein